MTHQAQRHRDVPRIRTGEDDAVDLDPAESDAVGFNAVGFDAVESDTVPVDAVDLEVVAFAVVAFAVVDSGWVAFAVAPKAVDGAGAAVDGLAHLHRVHERHHRRGRLLLNRGHRIRELQGPLRQRVDLRAEHHYVRGHTGHLQQRADRRAAHADADDAEVGDARHGHQPPQQSHEPPPSAGTVHENRDHRFDPRGFVGVLTPHHNCLLAVHFPPFTRPR